METDATPQWKMNAREIVQVLPSFVVGFTAVCFSVGLLIVNLRLARYGVFASELVRSEYVTAGALFIFLVTLTQLSLSYGLTQIESAAPRWREGRRIASAFTVIFGLIEIFAPLVTALNFMSDREFMWIVIGTLLGASITGSTLLQRLIEFSRVVLVPSSTESTEKRRTQLRGLLMLLVFNFSSITLYAYYAYPHLSPAIGGGKREQVMLRATEQGLSLSKSLLLPVQVGTQLIGPLQLLTKTDSEIVVIIEPSESMKLHALWLQRNMFEAMLTVPIQN